MVCTESSDLSKICEENRLLFVLTKIGFYDILQMNSLGHIQASQILCSSKFAWFVCPELEVSRTKKPLRKNQ